MTIVCKSYEVKDRTGHWQKKIGFFPNFYIGFYHDYDYLADIDFISCLLIESWLVENPTDKFHMQYLDKRLLYIFFVREDDALNFEKWWNSSSNNDIVE